MFKDFHFANPSACYFLFFSIALIALFAASFNRRKKSLANFASESSLSELLFLEKRTLLRYICLALAWLLASFALMQPEKIMPLKYSAQEQKKVLEESWKENEERLQVITKRRHCDVIFLLDTSASMGVKDTRQKCTRLESAVEIIDEMISSLDGQNVALYTFTSSLTPVVPPTLDYFFTRLMLKDITLNYGDVAGTDLFEALEDLSKRHFSSSADKQKVLVLLTDGGDTDFERLSGPERKKQMEVMLNKIKKFENQNLKIFTIGLGSLEGMVIPGVEFEGKAVVSSLDTELLTKLSHVGNGKYYFANDHSAIALSERIISEVRAENSYIESEETMRKKLEQKVNQNNENEKKQLFQIPLALAIIFLGFEIILPLWPLKRKASL